jgi:hypothetical protein|tara:strand:- start:292 stop:780 length:489 start_codon:yes stop_codon:yes gene_type:complete
MKSLSPLFFLVVLTYNALPALAENQALSLDKREVLVLTPIQRNHVLGEMQALLSGVQHILGALAEDDMEAVAASARPLGRSMASKAEDHLSAVLPRRFLQLGMDVHYDFDNLARLAESGADGKAVLGELSRLMRKCQACHAHYQIYPLKSSAIEEKRLDHRH